MMELSAFNSVYASRINLICCYLFATLISNIANNVIIITVVMIHSKKYFFATSK